jgi:pimeloyl-ACP methyl ester carboxylesterase
MTTSLENMPDHAPMSKPRWIDIQALNVELKALTWGPSDGPIALCLHGFPDTAYGWRNFAPRLAESGWRVVAPFMRGYGRDDGCMTSAFTRWIPDALPDDSDVSVVDGAGHFLQLDQPDRVADLVLEFIGSAR